MSQLDLRWFRPNLPPEPYYSWRAWESGRRPSGRLPYGVAAGLGKQEIAAGKVGGSHSDPAPQATAAMPGMDVWPAAVDGALIGLAPALAFFSIDPHVVAALDFSVNLGFLHSLVARGLKGLQLVGALHFG